MMKKVLPIIIVALMLIICGCDLLEVESEQRLLISAVTDTESSVTISEEQLNGNYDGTLKLWKVKDVSVALDGKSYPLETAIADGLITVEEIEAYARIDARNGFCEEITASGRGVSHFIYRYQGVCDLYFTHDVYETPDGSNPVMNYFAVSNNNDLDDTFYHGGSTLYDILEQNYPIDMEDWKLNFQITDVSTEGFTLHINQTSHPNRQLDTQQIGQLKIIELEIFDLSDLTKSYAYPFQNKGNNIVQGSTNSFKITFAEAEGFPTQLPSGNYRTYLHIMDDFNEGDVHPLMQDYHQFQGYWVDLVIP